MQLHLRLTFLRSLVEFLKKLVRDIRHLSTPLQDAPLPSPTQKTAMAYRAGFVLVLLGIWAILILVHLWKTQIVNHELHVSNAKRLLGIRQKFIGVRGEIRDCHGKLLAGNQATSTIYVTPWFLQQKDGKEFLPFCRFLSETLRIPQDEIQKKLEKGMERQLDILVTDKATEEQCRTFQQKKLPGIWLIPPADAENGGKIYFSPKRLTDDRELRQIIESTELLLNLPRNELLGKVTRAQNRKITLPIAKNIPQEQANAFLAKFREWNVIYTGKRKKRRQRVPGVTLQIEEGIVREYPRGSALANLLGFCNYNGKGISGVEQLMNEDLAGHEEIRFTDGDGAGVTRQNFSPVVYDQSMNGKNVFLTIDWVIQDIVEKNLQEIAEKYHPKNAYAIMMDPSTGAILALAQYPNFTPGGKALPGTPVSREFHALFYNYEPGSIMKGLSVSAALNKTNYAITHQVDCEHGKFSYKGTKTLHEHNNHDFGNLTIQQIIQKSSNVGSSKLVVEHLTMQQYYNYLLAFGLAQKTRLGFYPQDGEPRVFPGESTGQVKPLAKWLNVDFARMPIGHAIAVTPLQMIQAYGALANAGVMMQPYIVDSVVDAKGKVIRSQPFIKAQPISPETAAKMVECLKTVTMPGGTARAAAVKNYHVAGKTGTATKYTKERKNTASFIGFVPATNPAFVLLLTVDEPEGAYQTGGAVCGEGFSRIATETLKLLQIPPDNPAPRLPGNRSPRG